jgi:hypothetical protein
MHPMRKNKSIAFRAGGALLIAALTPQVAQGQEEAGRTADDNGGTQRGVWYSGYDPARGEHYLYSGATVALNGDLDRDGFHARVFGSWVAYDLNPGSGRGYQGDFMLGYRMTRGNIDGGLYIGVDYQHYNPHPDDPTDEVRGTEWGFKIAADVETLRNESPIYFSVAGEYSTSFQTYWARARIGRNLKGFAFGPEGVALGNVGFDAQRIGGFFIFDWKALPLMSPIEVTLNAGYQFVAGDNGGGGGVGGGEGAYGGIAFSLLF